nr:unnamed protein product [Spirometra erinaceieuropaei]
MRQQVSTLLLQHKRQMTISKAEDRELLKIRKIKDIVTLPADKGRSTVVMDKAEYCTNLGNLLMDKEAYVPSTVSEFKKLVNSINNTIGKLRKAGALTRREALAAKASDTAMARFYGLPKVHKQGVPLRPIVSIRGTPTFGLSKWLYQRLCFLTKDSQWTVKSAEEFLTRIKHLEVEADEVRVSFDVISLFTSIPPALAIDTIDGFLREKYDETDQQLKRAHIIELLELCLKTFFTFNGQVFEQKKGTPMGSPLSGLIAEAVLQRLEQQVFSSYPPKFWARYVDDTFVVIKRSEVKAFKALLNSIFPDIQFTMEEEVNNQLPFLDVQVTRLTDGKIRTTVYRKATNTRRILHFRSNHPVGHKRSCVRTLFQRVQTHCSDDSGRKEEMNYLHALFKANGYPKSFVRSCLKKPHFERSSGEKPKFWLSIPYVKNVSEATARILKPFGIGVAHKPECTIRQQIMKPKDPLPTTEQSAVVYSIPCQNCNARYVGETGKRLGTRLHEHQLAINRKDKLSLVYGHIRELNHDFAFEKARAGNLLYDLVTACVLTCRMSGSDTGTFFRSVSVTATVRSLTCRTSGCRDCCDDRTFARSKLKCSCVRVARGSYFSTSAGNLYGPATAYVLTCRMSGSEAGPFVESAYVTANVRFLTGWTSGCRDCCDDRTFARQTGVPPMWSLTSNAATTVCSAAQFLERLKGIRLSEDEVMVSFDVTALFTSIPQCLAVQTVSELLECKYDETEESVKRTHFIQLLKFCLKTFFTFDGRVYEQTKGTPMGSPLSGFIAEAVLQKVETGVFETYRPKFWARYVDDTFVIIKREMVQTFHNVLNSISPDIQFTMEAESNNELPFLDVLVHRNPNGHLKTTVYRKAANTRQILSYHSKHPLSHKRSCVRTLYKRADTHCSEPDDKRSELRHLQRLFMANGYPRNFIERNRQPVPSRSPVTERPKVWRALPYIDGVSEAVSRLLRPLGIGIVHRPESTIRHLVMRPKSPLPPGETTNVIYRIQCSSCEMNYIGETGKRLQTHVKEHMRAVRRMDQLSLVAEHCANSGHTFAFQSAEILGRGNDRVTRETIEAWHTSTNSINRCVALPEAYQALRTQLREQANKRWLRE